MKPPAKPQPLTVYCLFFSDRDGQSLLSIYENKDDAEAQAEELNKKLDDGMDIYITHAVEIVMRVASGEESVFE